MTRLAFCPALEFTLPDGTTRSVTVTRLFNAGYAGRAQEEVAAHVAELAELGVPAPSVTPATGDTLDLGYSVDRMPDPIGGHAVSTALMNYRPIP
jgi:hypothetical protein